MKGFLNSWKNGTTSVKKDSLEKHAKGKGVLKLCSNFTGEYPCQSKISIKLPSNTSEGYAHIHVHADGFTASILEAFERLS